MRIGRPPSRKIAVQAISVMAVLAIHAAIVASDPYAQDAPYDLPYATEIAMRIGSALAQIWPIVVIAGAFAACHVALHARGSSAVWSRFWVVAWLAIACYGALLAWALYLPRVGGEVIHSD